VAKEDKEKQLLLCRQEEQIKCLYSFGKIETELIAQKNLMEQMTVLFDTKLLAIDKALNVASVTMDKRLDGMNEFRDTLRDQAARFITRDEVKKENERIETDLRFLRESRAILEGKASQKLAYITLVATIVSFMLALTGIIANVLIRIFNN